MQHAIPAVAAFAPRCFGIATIAAVPSVSPKATGAAASQGFSHTSTRSSRLCHILDPPSRCRARPREDTAP